MTSLPCLHSTTNIHDSSGYAGGAAQIPQANKINDKSHPNSTTNIHNSSGYAGGAAQIPQATQSMTISSKFDHEQSRFIGLRRRCCQIPHVNPINDMSHPNSSTNINASAGYAGGTA